MNEHLNLIYNEAVWNNRKLYGDPPFPKFHMLQRPKFKIPLNSNCYCNASLPCEIDPQLLPDHQDLYQDDISLIIYKMLL